MNTIPGSRALNTTNMASGSFYKPEVVLDNIARSQKTEDGIIVISARDVSGRIGVTNNNIIVGGVVDGTGETGITAVCKLLLLPYGTYTFRRSTPVDKVHIWEQELKLTFDEAKTFLQGPSSIGLNRPADHVLSNLQSPDAPRAVRETIDGFGWEPTSLRSTQDAVAEPLVTYGGAQAIESGVYLHDCNKLLESVDKKRQDEIAVLSQPRKTNTDLELLKPGPLPSRKNQEPTMHWGWVIAALFILVGVAGLAVLNKQSNSMLVDETPAIAAAGPTDQGGSPAPATPAEAPPEAPAATGAAPFSFPSGSSNNSSPPANPPAPEEPVKAPVALPTVQGTSPTAAVPASVDMGNSSGNQEVFKWTDAVRANPSDPKARRALSYAFLQVGNANSSIEQYYAVMKLQKVDATDIIEYADNIQVFCGRAPAKQFLTDVLRSDPAQTAIREKLSSCA